MKPLSLGLLFAIGMAFGALLALAWLEWQVGFRLQP